MGKRFILVCYSDQYDSEEMRAIYSQYTDVKFLTCKDGKMKSEDYVKVFETILPAFKEKVMLFCDWPEDTFDLIMFQNMLLKNIYVTRYEEVLHEVLATQDNVFKLLSDSIGETISG